MGSKHKTMGSLCDRLRTESYSGPLNLIWIMPTEENSYDQKVLVKQIYHKRIYLFFISIFGGKENVR